MVKSAWAKEGTGLYASFSEGGARSEVDTTTDMDVDGAGGGRGGSSSDTTTATDGNAKVTRGGGGIVYPHTKAGAAAAAKVAEDTAEEAYLAVQAADEAVEKWGQGYEEDVSIVMGDNVVLKGVVCVVVEAEMDGDDDDTIAFTVLRPNGRKTTLSSLSRVSPVPGADTEAAAAISVAAAAEKVSVAASDVAEAVSAAVAMRVLIEGGEDGEGGEGGEGNKDTTADMDVEGTESKKDGDGGDGGEEDTTYTVVFDGKQVLLVATDGGWDSQNGRDGKVLCVVVRQCKPLY
jgi:hypothetical protein